MTDKFTQYPSRSSAVSTAPHFAVLIDESYSEGSHDDYTRHEYMQYMQFTSEDDLNAWILNNHGKKSFRVIYSSPVSFKLTSTVSISKG